MDWSLLICLFYLGLTAAQKVGNLQNETHPRLQWSSCAAGGGCEKRDGELTLDADFRWLHRVDNYMSCYEGNTWNERFCSTVENCTNTCALEGADYAKVYGVKTANDSVSLRFRTNFDFAYNVGSRLFLMESKHRYQMFTLTDNELACDVDLSTVECGINSALYFVPMDPHGGRARYPTNAAGAQYGTGYCDASCPRSLRFVGGKANMEGWIPSETDEFSGKGRWAPAVRSLASGTPTRTRSPCRRTLVPTTARRSASSGNVTTMRPTRRTGAGSPSVICGGAATTRIRWAARVSMGRESRWIRRGSLRAFWSLLVFLRPWVKWMA